MPTPRPRALAVCAAALVAAAFGAGRGASNAPTSSSTTSTATSTTPASTAAPFRGEAARAAAAIGVLTSALRDGDVERLCRPDAIFTAAVVHEMRSDGTSCEASVEGTLAARGAPAMTVAGVSVDPGLATAHVRVAGGATVPLSLVRDAGRWLVSFSDGNDPLSSLTA